MATASSVVRLSSLCFLWLHAAASDEAQCSSAEPDCAADEAGMLQAVMLPHSGPGLAQHAPDPPSTAQVPHHADEEVGPAMTQMADAEELHLQSNLTGCSGGIAMEYLDVKHPPTAKASFQFSAANPSSVKCAETGSLGPNDCCLKWGSVLSGTMSLKTTDPIDDQYTINIDGSGWYGWVPVWGRAECPACGGTCHICSNIPLVPCAKIPLPACPIPPADTTISKTFTNYDSFPIPGNFWGDSLSLSATVELMGPTKDIVGAIKVEIKMSP